LEPELGARVRYQGRVGTVTHTRLTTTARQRGDLPLSGARRFVTIYLDPGPDRRGEEVQLFESDWAQIEPAEE
jgi:hypothetical protein